VSPFDLLHRYQQVSMQSASENQYESKVPEIKQESSSDVQRTPTYSEGDVVNLTAENNGLHKSFTNRHVHVSASLVIHAFYALPTIVLLGNLSRLEHWQRRLHLDWSSPTLRSVHLSHNLWLWLTPPLAGPGNMLLGYGLVCTLVASMLHTIAEMTIAFPVSGNFVDYADRFIDPAMAFAVGFAEWLGLRPAMP
jgi:hypothetical protein